MKEAKCKHEWRIINRWYDEKNNYFRFYCKHCLEMQVIIEAKAIKNENEDKSEGLGLIKNSDLWGGK